MIEGNRVLAVIPARGGSKGVPRKNLRMVGGRPLIAWTIAQALAAPSLDRVIVSSEDEEILAVARTWGAETPFVRPQALSADTTPGVDPVLHALEALPGHDYVVLLQPTSPLRSAADIEGCLEHLHACAAPCCVSVSMAAHSPYWMFWMAPSSRLHPVLDGPAPLRRQDLPPAYALNGAVYAARTSWLQQHRSFLSTDTVGYLMPAERSLDIDTEEDFQQAQVRLESSHGKA